MKPDMKETSWVWGPQLAKLWSINKWRISQMEDLGKLWKGFMPLSWLGTGYKWDSTELYAYNVRTFLCLPSTPRPWHLCTGLSWQVSSPGFWPWPYPVWVVNSRMGPRSTPDGPGSHLPAATRPLVSGSGWGGWWRNAWRLCSGSVGIRPPPPSLWPPRRWWGPVRTPAPL